MTHTGQALSHLPAFNRAQQADVLYLDDSRNFDWSSELGEIFQQVKSDDIAL